MIPDYGVKTLTMEHLGLEIVNLFQQGLESKAVAGRVEPKEGLGDCWLFAAKQPTLDGYSQVPRYMTFTDHCILEDPTVWFRIPSTFVTLLHDVYFDNGP